MPKRKYDHKKIVEDYEDGLSLTDLNKKYGICISTAHQIIKKNSKLRSVSESLILKKSGSHTWRKLTRMKTSPTRILSVPAAVLEKLNVNPYDNNKTLLGKWKVDKRNERLILEIREEPLKKITEKYII